MSDQTAFPVSGCIVECMLANKPTVHWVLDVSGDTVRLLSKTRRESTMNVSRLLPWFGPVHPSDQSREAIEKILHEHEAKRDEALKDIAILDVWDTVRDANSRVDAKFLADLMWQAPDADHIAAMGHAALGCKTHFKFSPPYFDVFDAETVARKIAEQEAVKEREALAGVGSEFFRALWGHHIKARGPLQDHELPPLDLAKILERMLRDRIADPEGTEHAELWKLLTKSLPEDPHLPVHLATAWGIVKRHHNVWLDRACYAYAEEWYAEHVTELNALKERVSSIRDQEPETISDSHDTPFVSIDPANTADVDDAFSVRKNEDGTFTLFLAFACPSRFWPFSSALDKTILGRASSLYLPECDHHMIPHEAGADLFSLHQGERRPCTLLEAHLASDGALLSFTPRLSWVRLDANLSLPGCQAVLDGSKATVKVTAKQIMTAAPFSAMLKEAQEIAVELQKRRIERGAVITERPDPEVALEHDPETGEPAVSVSHAPETPSAQSLVGELMILANNALAEWALARDIPLIFRTQDVALPKEFAGVWTEPQDIARIVKHIPPSKLEVTPRPHAGLGVPVYAPLTSPIRRYTDLINTAQIISFLENGVPRLSREELAQLLPAIATANDAVSQVQRFRPRYWKLLFYKQMGDSMWWEAVVTEENDAFATLSLPLTQIAVRARRKIMGEKVFPGQKVKVRLGKIDPLRNEIRVLAAMEQ